MVVWDWIRRDYCGLDNLRCWFIVQKAMRRHSRAIHATDETGRTRWQIRKGLKGMWK